GNDYYVLFGIEPSASAEEIARAHKRLAKECHPDLHPDKAWATERFKEVNRAYAVLKDPVSKGEYDRQRWAKVGQGKTGQQSGSRPGSYNFKSPQKGEGYVDPDRHHRDRMMSYFIMSLEVLALVSLFLLVAWRALTKHKF
ncbi:MAG: J domain-containing protein, partial [Leptospirillia bacterium]